MRLLRCKPSIRGSRASACFFEAASGGKQGVCARFRPAAPPFLIPEKWPAPLRRRRLALLERRSFLVETTLSGTGIFRLMEAVRNKDYRVALHYVSLGSPERALDPIRNRVALGGHVVPENDARRRFLRSHSNLRTAFQLADEVVFYDNSFSDQPYRVVAIFKEESLWVSDDVPDWASHIIARASTLRVG